MPIITSVHAPLAKGEMQGTRTLSMPTDRRCQWVGLLRINWQEAGNYLLT